jgi:hypothetical protein
MIILVSRWVLNSDGTSPAYCFKFDDYDKAVRFYSKIKDDIIGDDDELPQIYYDENQKSYNVIDEKQD